MPQPRKHADPAARTRAWRVRKKLEAADAEVSRLVSHQADLDEAADILYKSLRDGIDYLNSRCNHFVRLNPRERYSLADLVHIAESVAFMQRTRPLEIERAERAAALALADFQDLGL